MAGEKTSLPLWARAADLRLAPRGETRIRQSRRVEDRMLGVERQTTAGEPKRTICEITGRFAAAWK